MTSVPAPPDHSELDDLLRQHGAVQGGSELHGFLTGALAAGRRYNRSDWLRTVVEQADLGTHPDEVTGDRLYSLYRRTLSALTTDDLDFEPLLAADDESLVRRAATLGSWCQGFLSGFGLAGGSARDDEVAEALGDLAAVAQVAAEDESESSENDFFAISEYVRLAVLNIAWKGQPQGEPVPAPGTAAGSPASLFQRNKLH